MPVVLLPLNPFCRQTFGDWGVFIYVMKNDKRFLDFIKHNL